MTDTPLLRILRLLYHHHDADTAQIEQQLIEARKRAWVTAMEAEARRWGYTGSIPEPRAHDLAWIRKESRKDAQSISRTWNRDVDRQLDRLYAENPRGNRHYYAARMEAWAAQRATWKDRQIASYTEMSTKARVVQRFEQKNDLTGGLKIFTGPPPVCGECVELYAMGPVEPSVARRYPAPRHVGCTHWWETMRASVILPNPRNLWVG